MKLKLEEQLSKENVFSRLIEKHFLENTHRLKFVATPDAEYNNKLVADEKKKLSEYVMKLSEETKAKIVEEGIQLQHYQNSPQGNFFGRFCFVLFYFIFDL